VSAEANPARGLERNREEGRERFLSDEELARLGASLRLAETDGLPWAEVDLSTPKSKHHVKPENRRTVYSPFVVGALRMLLLSGMRLREVLHLRWPEVDFQRGMLFLGDSKTGRKSVVLSGAALQLLTDLPRDGNCDLCFPGEGGQPRRDLNKPWAALKKHAGLEGLRLHDLRHSNASVGAGAGVPLQIIGRILGHSQVATTAKYAHLQNDPVRRAADTISAHLTAAMGDASEAADVVPIRRSR
jgi:integrase